MSSEQQVPQNPNSQVSPRIVTFYSFKGGVGRSMILANVAMLLARDRALKVIAVDWDLEAPGLNRYFGVSDEALGPGVIDYLQNYKRMIRDAERKISAKDLSIEKYLHQLDKFSGGGSIQFLGAGSQRSKAKYAEAVRTFDWDNFYREWNGAQVIEALRTEFKRLADVCLIDSRTGITDIGGICTVQLPDVVVFVFAFNGQNLAGIEQVARELSSPDNPSVRALGRRPEFIFLPSRKELSEVGKLRHWEKEASETFEIFCNTPEIKGTYGDVITYLRKMSVPYIPYFAYGEELAARSSKGIELTEALDPLVKSILGQNYHSESTSPAGSRFRELSERIVVIAAVGGAFAFFIGALAAIGYGGYLIYTELPLINKTLNEINKTLNEAPAPFGRLLVGGVAGSVGGLLSSFLNYYSKIREDFSRLSERQFVSRLVVDSTGGSMVGFGIAALSSTTDNLALLCGVAGFAWPQLAERFGRKRDD